MIIEILAQNISKYIDIVLNVLYYKYIKNYKYTKRRVDNE